MRGINNLNHKIILRFIKTPNFKSFAYAISQVLFPPVCVFCGANIKHEYLLEGVCRLCISQIPFRNISKNKIKCLEQRTEKQVQKLERFNIDVFVACNYDNMIRKSIVAMKFYDAAYMKHAFGSIISYIIGLQDEKFDGIIPIPLHKSRFKERGYNQAELIAKKVSEITGIPLIQNCLVRNINTKRQSEMSHYDQRLQNVSDAFFCKYPEQIINKKVLLLDDILTSGETIISAANAIKDAVERFKGINPRQDCPYEITGIVIASSRK